MRPKRTPSVRATLGRRSGPITTSATMPTTKSSDNEMSNMPGVRRGATRCEAASALLLVLDLALDGQARGGDLARLLRLLALHAVLEALDGPAEVAAHVAQLLGPEDEQHDHQDDDPVPDA